MPRTATNHWSNTTGTYSKDNIPLLVTGQRDNKWDEDRVKMERHLKFSSLDQAMYPEKEPFGRMFNPLDVPILDILAVEKEREFGWQYPSQATMMGLQANRGLARSMLKTCDVNELVLNGEQSDEEQKEIIDWHYRQLAKDQAEMPGAPSPSMSSRFHAPLWTSMTLLDNVLTREIMYDSTPDLDGNTTDTTLTGTSNSPAALYGGMD